MFLLFDQCVLSRHERASDRNTGSRKRTWCSCCQASVRHHSTPRSEGDVQLWPISNPYTNSHKQSGTTESRSLCKTHIASTTHIHLYISTTLGLSINKHWAALKAHKMEMIVLKPKARGIKKLVGKYNFWCNCHKERLAGELLQECSWQEHHKLWQNIKYAQAAKCKLTWQGFTVAAAA